LRAEAVSHIYAPIVLDGEMSYDDQKYRVIDAALRPGSQADSLYRKASAKFRRSRISPAAGLGPNDLFLQGGRIVAESLFRNVFLGGSEAWGGTDPSRIEDAIKRALSDRRLENVMRQYFSTPRTSCDGLEGVLQSWSARDEVTRADVDGVLQQLFTENPGFARDLDVTIFNIVLPRGVVLRSGQSSSLGGLGGFHGSTALHLGGRKADVYYSLTVASEERADGSNGIPIFNSVWKNIVATLYHEINEFRTDPDVEKANAAATEAEALDLVGWISNSNEEVGDHPLSGDSSLSDVFREVLLADGVRRVPTQFMYSNAVHGPQGPVALPSDATKREGHGVGLRGIDTAAATDTTEARFGRLFPELPARGNVAPFPEDLGMPGGAMDGGTQHKDSSTLFAVLTYFGQFVDHDITFDPTSSLERQQDTGAIRNFRTPSLELDNIYGSGPVANPFLYDQTRPNKFLLGRASNDPAEVDLPRNVQGVALIGDPRNDENLIVAQLHLAFLKFHNAVVDQLATIDDGIQDDNAFEKAQRIVRWHYQWLVLHEFLPAIVGDDTLKAVLSDGRKLYTPQNAFIPVEFSVAAYRFGHSMVQPGYGINDAFGAVLFPSSPDASQPGVGQARRDLRGGPLRFEERVNWKNFVDTGAPKSPGAPTIRSSKIDTLLSPSLLNLPTSVVPPSVPPPLRSLAVRNLKRGVALALPSGQDVANAVAHALPGTRVLTDDELWGKPSTHAFKGSAAPLWYYVLREAEFLADGEHLGPIGARITAEVLVGLLDLDPSSFRRRKPDWTPQVNGRENQMKFTFSDLFRLAGTDVS
jgi:hypothetical protein